MTGDQDLLVVDRARGHQLGDDLEALAGQSQKRDDVRLGVSFVALIPLSALRRIGRASVHVWAKPSIVVTVDA